MAPLTIDGSNLGEKHQSFNTLVKDAIAKQEDIDFNLQVDDDLQNLMKIEVAAANRKVEFILEVLKSEDMLYVSRALKRSTWLITDNQYAHIINPEYLYNELFPHMTVRASNKFLLSIRLHLKDEPRVERFYKYFIVRDHKAAFKWLQYCSITFIKEEVRKYKDEIPANITKKIFMKSFEIYEAFCSVTPYPYRLSEDKVSLNTFALQNTEQFLNLLEESKNMWLFNFDQNITRHFMKNCPERIVNKIDSYHNCIHLTTFIKCIKDRPDLIDILIHKAKEDDGYNFFDQVYFEHWKHLLPEANRFDLIKKYFIDGEDVEKEEIVYFRLCKINNYDPETTYKLYKHAPFNVAFGELKQLVRTVSDPETRNSMLEVMLTSAGKDLANIRVFLKYYLERHINEAYKFKKIFLDLFLAQTEPHTFDDETWNILNRLFHSLEVYINSDNNIQNCVEAIIVRSAIHGVDISDIVQSKFKFNTMKSYDKKLKDQKHKDALFDYLYKHLNKNIENMQITTDNDFSKLLATFTQLLELLKDWKKDIQEYPIILDRIKQLIELKKQHNYKTDLSSLYNTNQAWRRVLFEESMSLLPNDYVCVNAIKHDINLFQRYKDEILNNDRVILKQTFMKIRVYWPDTLSKEIKTLYAERLKHATSFDALITGISLLYSQRELKTFIKTYAPTIEKFDWGGTDDTVFHLRKHIAMKVYKARPLVPVEFVIMYAKGDYLQYTIPSLSAILSQKSLTKGKELIPKLLDAPVSLQKFGIRYAVQKLDVVDLTPICTEIWKSTKNCTIRMVLLTTMRMRLCQEQDENIIKSIWEVMTTCIDRLTFNENKSLFKKLTNLTNIPLSVKPEYFMKVYKLLSSLSVKHKDRFKTLIDEMKTYFRDSNNTFMEVLDDDFVIDFMLTDFFAEIEKDDYWYKGRHIFISFILHNKDEDRQVRRYEKFLAPFLDSFIASWSAEVHGDTTLKQLIQSVLAELTKTFTENVLEQKMNIPYKVFQKIYLQLKEGLKYERNYVLITYWKFAAEFARLISENKDIFMSSEDMEKKLFELHKNIAPDFGKFCAETFREDLTRFHPSIYLLFTKVLSDFFDDFNQTFDYSKEILLNYHKCILENGKEEEFYMAIIPLIENTIEYMYAKEKWTLAKDVQGLLYKHPSKALKLYYYNIFPTDYEP